MEGSIGKKAQQLSGGAIILLLIVAILVFKPGILGGGTQTTQPTAQPPPSSGGSLGTVEVVGKCGQPVTFTVDLVEKYAESTSMSSQNATVVVNGEERAVRSDGGTLTLAEGDNVDIYYALDPAGSAYQASKASGVLPNCKPSVTSSDNTIFDPDNAYKLYDVQTQPTITTINLENYETLNGVGTNLSIGAGATKTARNTITWTFEEGYGTLDGSTLACRFTDSQIDQSATSAVLDGRQLDVAKYVPSNTRFSLSAANQSSKFWSFPAIDGKTQSSSTLDLKIKGDDTNQPTTATNFSCEVKDADYYKTDGGQYMIDVEDRDDNSEVGRAASAELSFNIPLG